MSKPNHNSRIPPSLAIARYLHDYAQAQSIHLVGPLTEGKPDISPPVIYVDGGARFKVGANGLSVGDGDSYDGELDERLNTNKNYSDLAYVLASLPAHFHEVTMHGFLGGRRDHEWINLGEAHTFLKNRYQPTKIQLGKNTTGFSAGSWRLVAQGTFSLLCVEKVKATLEGECEYELNQATTIEPLSSFGLSNVGDGEVVLKIDRPAFLVFSEAE